MDFGMALDPVEDNAEAGPSSSSSYFRQPEASTSTTAIPPVFLPPPPHPTKIPSFSASQDLLGLLRLQEAYDKYVKPHAVPVDQWQTSPRPISDKGKGKERDPGDVDVNMDAGSPNDRPSNPEDPSKGSKKRKKEGTYRHLIKSIVGKHSMKKDTYLVDMISVPPKQKVDIRSFDERTQNDAFWVSLEGLKGYNIHALIPETDQAREDRKRRKEAKKAEKVEKARLAALSAGTGDPTPAPDQGVQPLQVPTPMTNGAPTPGANASLIAGAPNGMDVKRERMTNHVPTQASQQTQQRTNGKVSTPIAQRPSTPLDRQGSAQNPQRPQTPQQRQQHLPQQQPQQQQRPQPTPTQAPTQTHSRVNLSAHSQSHIPEVNPRGVKRERPGTPQAQQLHSASHTHTPQVYTNHHGMVGHPATAKKRRLESATAVR